MHDFINIYFVKASIFYSPSTNPWKLAFGIKRMYSKDVPKTHNPGEQLNLDICRPSWDKKLSHQLNLSIGKPTCYPACKFFYLILVWCLVDGLLSIIIIYNGVIKLHETNIVVIKNSNHKFLLIKLSCSIICL